MSGSHGYQHIPVGVPGAMMDLMRKASTWTWIIHVLIWNICGSLRGASLLDLSFTRGSFSFSFSSASYPHSSSSWHSSLSASSSHSSFTCWQEQVFFFFLFFFFPRIRRPPQLSSAPRAVFPNFGCWLWAHCSTSHCFYTRACYGKFVSTHCQIDVIFQLFFE